MDGAYDTNDAFNLMAEKGVDCPGIKIRENAVVGDEPSQGQMLFSNCCDFVGSSLDEIEASRKTDTEPGSKCTNTGDDGQSKVYSLQSSGFLGRP